MSKALLCGPLPTWISEKRGVTSDLFCLWRLCRCAALARDCFFCTHAFVLFCYYTILNSWFERHIHTLSSPDICSEPYSSSDKKKSGPRGRFDSVYCVKSILRSSNERQNSCNEALHFSSMLYLILHFKSHTLKLSVYR